MRPTREKRRLKDNPWELLVVGTLFFFPGVFMLLQHGPLIAVQQVYRYTYLLPSGVTAISEHGAHVFGTLAMGVGGVFILFYFYLRSMIARSTPHVVEHGREQI